MNFPLKFVVFYCENETPVVLSDASGGCKISPLETLERAEDLIIFTVQGGIENFVYPTLHAPNLAKNYNIEFNSDLKGLELYNQVRALYHKLRRLNVLGLEYQASKFIKNRQCYIYFDKKAFSHLTSLLEFEIMDAKKEINCDINIKSPNEVTSFLAGCENPEATQKAIQAIRSKQNTITSPQNIPKKFKPLYSNFGTVTGRYTTANPNIQGLKKTPELLRCFNIPECVLYSFDYAEQEARIFIAYCALKGISEGKELYAKLKADKSFSIYDYLTIKLQATREEVKLAFLIGINGGRQELNLPMFQEAQKIALEEARVNGGVLTLTGRFIPAPPKPHQAINRIIQGTGADQIKYTLANLQQSKADLALLRYDEIVFALRAELKTEEIQEELSYVTKIMENAIPQVPALVKIKKSSTLDFISEIISEIK